MFGICFEVHHNRTKITQFKESISMLFNFETLRARHYLSQMSSFILTNNTCASCKQLNLAKLTMKNIASTRTGQTMTAPRMANNEKLLICMTNCFSKPLFWYCRLNIEFQICILIKNVYSRQLYGVLYGN